MKCTLGFEDQCSYEQQSKGFQSWSSACLSTSLAASLTLECPSLLVCSSCHCSGDWKFPQDLTWGQLKRKGIFTWLWEPRQCSLVLVPHHAAPDSYWQGWAADPTLFLQALSPSSEFSWNKINFNPGITLPAPCVSHPQAVPSVVLKLKRSFLSLEGTDIDLVGYLKSSHWKFF